MNTRTYLLPFGLWSTLSTGCGDSGYVITVEDARAYALARCEAARGCCASSTEDDCESLRESALLHYQELTESPLAFSGTCMHEVLEWAQRSGGIGCATPGDLDAPGCQIAHGELARGEPCVDFGDLGFYGTDCAEGLECRDGRCASGPYSVHEAPLGDPCDIPGWRCVDGAYCGSGGTCVPQVALGQPCEEDVACLLSFTENYCAGLSSGTGSCATRPVLGEPCVEAEDACAFHCSDDGHLCEKPQCAEGTCSPRLPAVCEDLGP